MFVVAALAPGSSAMAQRVPTLSESAVLEGAPGAPEASPISPGVRVFFRPDEIPMVTIREGMRRGVVAGNTISVSVDELDPLHIKGSPPVMVIIRIPGDFCNCWTAALCLLGF